MIIGDRNLAKRVEPGPSTIGKDGVIQQGKPSGPPHEGSRETYEGKIISVPKDYCYKKVGSGKIIIGFRIWAWQREATNLADSVTQGSLRSHVKGSYIQHCYGDEKGDGGGIWSHTHNAECTPKTWSETVTFEGRNAVRDSDEWWMNHRNTWGVLDYKKDMSSKATPTAKTVDARMQLAFAGDPEKFKSPAEELDKDMGGGGALPSGGGGGAGWGDPFEYKTQQMNRILNNAILRLIIEERERRDAEEAKKQGVRETANCRKQLICFTNSKGLDLGAYQEQLTMQQNGINEKPACQNVADIDKFDRQPDKDAYRALGDEEKGRLLRGYKASHPGADMSNLNALHEIDMVAGGDPKKFGGVGNANVNQAIGSSWNKKNRKKDLYDYAKQMCAAKCKMAVTLSICSYTTPSRGVGAQ